MHCLAWKCLDFDFSPNGSNSNKSYSVPTMAWRRTGDKLVSGPSLLIHNCVTRPWWCINNRAYNWLKGQSWLNIMYCYPIKRDNLGRYMIVTGDYDIGCDCWPWIDHERLFVYTEIYCHAFFETKTMICIFILYFVTASAALACFFLYKLMNWAPSQYKDRLFQVWILPC